VCDQPTETRMTQQRRVLRRKRPNWKNILFDSHSRRVDPSYPLLEERKKKHLARTSHRQRTWNSLRDDQYSEINENSAQPLTTGRKSKVKTRKGTSLNRSQDGVEKTVPANKKAWTSMGRIQGDDMYKRREDLHEPTSTALRVDLLKSLFLLSLVTGHQPEYLCHDRFRRVPR